MLRGHHTLGTSWKWRQCNQRAVAAATCCKHHMSRLALTLTSLTQSMGHTRLGTKLTDAHSCGSVSQYDGLRQRLNGTAMVPVGVNLKGKVRRRPRPPQNESVEHRGHSNSAGAGDRSGKFLELAAADFTSREQEFFFLRVAEEQGFLQLGCWKVDAARKRGCALVREDSRQPYQCNNLQRPFCPHSLDVFFFLVQPHICTTHAELHLLHVTFRLIWAQKKRPQVSSKGDVSHLCLRV